MSVIRRTLLKGMGLTALTTGFAGGIAPLNLVHTWAKSNINLGAMNIDVLSDGHLVQPVSFLLGDAPADEVKSLFAKYNLPTDVMQPSCNLTLVRDGDKTILFDVGSGPNFMPTAGKISEALDAINLDAGEVTHVLFTHAHPDHLWDCSMILMIRCFQMPNI